MATEQALQRRIMRRVWGVYFLRQATSPTVRLLVCALALAVITQIVSVPAVLANALGTSGIVGLLNLAYSALLTTETAVLFWTTLAVGMFLWFIVDQVASNFQGQVAAVR